MLSKKIRVARVFSAFLALYALTIVALAEEEIAPIEDPTEEIYDDSDATLHESTKPQRAAQVKSTAPTPNPQENVSAEKPTTPTGPAANQKTAQDTQAEANRKTQTNTKSQNDKVGETRAAQKKSKKMQANKKSQASKKAKKQSNKMPNKIN